MPRGVYERIPGRRPKHSEETKLKISVSQRGSKSHFWKGGITSKNLCERSSAKYRNWRKAVYERDNYTCVKCGQRGGELNADHIKPFSTHIGLRYKISNGRTLCIKCHKETDTWGYKAKLITS